MDEILKELGEHADSIDSPRERTATFDE